MEEKTIDQEVEVTSQENSQKDVKRLIFLSKLRRFLRRHVVLVRITILVFILGIVVTPFVILFRVLNSSGLSNYLYLVKTFVTTPMDKVEVEDDRTNILILGKGGVGHEAPDLTDTMIFASISHTGGKPILVSLPRDIWVDELRAKLNSAYYWGNQKTPGGGLTLAKATVSGIVGKPIHYAMVVDMSGLSSLIDLLGGVDVDVETAFTDNKFPIPGREGDLCGGDRTFACRYETITFERGTKHMSGELALKFVRSRNAEGDEGTDFARAKRQQKVLEGVQKRLLSRDIYLNPTKIKELLALIENTVETDIDEEAGAIIGRRLFDTRDIRESHVLSEDLLVNPPISRKYDNLYVFVPKVEGWSEVHSWVENLLK